jgi:two-component system heavy metal sensor histidine kinase CusS
MILSLRSRLVVRVVLGLAVVLCSLCVLIYAVTRYALISNFDKSLLDTAKMLSAIVELEGGDGIAERQQEHHGRHAPPRAGQRIDFDFDVSLTPEFDNPRGGAYYQFTDGDGTAIISSPSLAGAELNVFAQLSGPPRYKQCVLPDGRVGRAIGFQFIPPGNRQPDDGPFSIVVARDAGGIYNHLSFLKWLLLISSAAGVLLSVVVALFVSGTGLRPVGTLADEISRVDTDNFDNTSISGEYPQELLPVIRCLNDLLARLKRSLDREKRFSSDIAHELRTPVAGIQTTIEVALSRPREPKEYQADLKTCLQIVKSTNRMIETVLSLARLESKQLPLQQEHIALKDLIDNCWVSFADRAYDKGTKFDNYVGENTGCFSDKTLMSMIFSNILDNAVEYCDKGGRIWIEAEESVEFITVSISNTGCKLNPQEADDVFSAFWRGDESRENTGTHCGIGLTVVQRLVRILGGKIKAQVGPESIFTVRLSLPA